VARRTVVARPWKADNQELKVRDEPADGDRAATRTDAGPTTEGMMLMKFRLFRLMTTVAMLAVLLEALGAGAKWG
jgi:hypothetical protein